jgi:hypothetical protein
MVGHPSTRSGIKPGERINVVVWQGVRKKKDRQEEGKKRIRWFCG